MSRVSGSTRSGDFNVRDTVATETPASRATSRILDKTTSFSNSAAGELTAGRPWAEMFVDVKPGFDTSPNSA
ncbi:hypothetical protein D3C87_1482300 [compost metagenome]